MKTNKGWRNTQELASREELPAVDLQEKRQRAVNQDPVSTVVIAEMSPSWGCGFMKRTTGTVKLTVNRGWRPSKEGIFFLFLPMHQLKPPFCRTQLGARGQGSQDDILCSCRSASQVCAGQKGRE